jgi:phenylacetate-CoA ligase
MVRGYARAVGELFDRARREGVALHRPALAVLGGEALLPEMRAALTEHFGVPVFMSYSSNEALRIGFECGAGPGYHLHEDLCAVRIVDDDGRTLAPGEKGRVIISNLMNRGTMLLNYDQGDRARLIAEPCACGRSSTRIELTETRDVPMLKTLDGRVIHSAELLLSLGDHPEIDLAQIVIEAPGRWRVLLISADPGATRRWLERAAQWVRERAGPTVEVAVELTDTPALSRAGKTLPVIVRCWGAPPYHD